MNNWSEQQQKRSGTYERNLKIGELAFLGVPYRIIGDIQKPPITRQRVCQVLQEIERANEKMDADWSGVRDEYGGYPVENDR